MDNFSLSVTSEGRAEFDTLLQIFFNHAPGLYATHYSVNDKHELTFYWSDPKGNGAIKLPFEMKGADAAHFAWGWLEHQSCGPRPDHDGDNGRGFFMSCDYWGHAEKSCYGFVSIKATWAMYGK